MSGITLAQAEAQLTIWLAADAAVASGQAYSVAGRALTRANAREIRENIEFWDKKVNALSRSSGGGIATKFFTPVTD